ncbi:hypothetical protein [Drosophila suzukii associated hytrosavirus 1]|nr:hypothetical protein [Drosophila suzukii associated hytrosavirus 1]
MNRASVDVLCWVEETTKKYTFEEICSKLNIDISDSFTKCILNTDLTKMIVIDEYYLDLMGFVGKNFKTKQKQFKRLLKRNPEIQYERMYKNEQKCHVIRGWDFETLFMQVGGRNGDMFRQQSKILRDAFKKYWEYKELYYMRNEYKI